MSKNFRGEDLAGKKFNKLTVIKFVQTKDSCSAWLCRCDCGNEKILRIDHIKGKVKSCGCDRNRKTHDLSMYYKYIGKKFNMMTVMDVCFRKGRCHLVVKCDCGKVKKSIVHNIIGGKQYSCGCVSSSKQEREIEEELLKYNIKYVKQKTFSDLRLKKRLHFDFFLPEHNCIIEYDGKQHFENNPNRLYSRKFDKTRERDIIKNKYCFDKNIFLIRIPYYLKEDICLEQLLPCSTWFRISNEDDFNDYIKLEKIDNKREYLFFSIN